VQVDFGRQFSNKVARKDTLADNLSRPNTEIHAFLAKMRGLRSRTQLTNGTFVYLTELCQKKGIERSGYPGAEEDKLYELTYRHKHHETTVCAICAKCENKEDDVCDTASRSSCMDLRCDDNKQVARHRVKAIQATANEEAAEARKPVIHFGFIASGDLVMKSAYHRDEVAARENVIAFEMEGAGVWDNFPTVVIKGVCDYVDSHKNKKWQRYAAATAACCMKSFLKEWRPTDEMTSPQIESCR
jgi:hypothetical protein